MCVCCIIFRKETNISPNGHNEYYMKTQPTRIQDSSMKASSSPSLIVLSALILQTICVSSAFGFTIGGQAAVRNRRNSLLGSPTVVGSTRPKADESNHQSNRKFWKKKHEKIPTENDQHGSEDQAVDEYLEFLDRRYRYVSLFGVFPISSLTICHSLDVYMTERRRIQMNSSNPLFLLGTG